MKPPVVLLAGGKGTRLGSLTKDTPKPLVTINGRAVLDHILIRLRLEGFERFIICVGHLAHKMAEHEFPVPVELIYEQEPLGTGGATRKAFELKGLDEAWVLNADTLRDTPLPEPIDGDFVYLSTSDNYDSGAYYVRKTAFREETDSIHGLCRMYQGIRFQQIPGKFYDMGTLQGLEQFKDYLDSIPYGVR